MGSKGGTTYARAKNIHLNASKIKIIRKIIYFFNSFSFDVLYCFMMKNLIRKALFY